MPGVTNMLNFAWIFPIYSACPGLVAEQQIGTGTFKAFVNFDMSVGFWKPLKTWVPLHGLKSRIGDRGTCRSVSFVFLFVLGGPRWGHDDSG